MKIRLAASFLLQTFACFGAISGTGQEWTDRKEYDLVLEIRSEASPEKRLVLLDSWSQRYPKTALSGARQELYLNTYELLGDRPHMFDVARELLTVRADDPVALYWLTVLTPQQPNPTESVLEAGDNAAHKLIASNDAYFSADRKPAAVSDADWQKQKLNVEVMGHRTLGWVYWQRSKLAEAEDELSLCLKKDPGNADVSSWLAIVLAIDKDKQPQSLWQFARATNIQLSSPLPDEQRRQVNSMLENMYVSYHGSTEGLDNLKKYAASAALPPPSFTIDPITVVNARREELELSKTNPELASWMATRRQLEAPDGDSYFAASILGKNLPKFRGTVIKGTPPRSQEISLSMNEPGIAEVMLKLEIPLGRPVAPGATILFQGTGVSYTKSPFELVVKADTAEVEPKSARTP